MDLRLPDMEGTEATRTLADAERTARIPVVAWSAMRLEGSGDWLEAAGFAGGSRSRSGWTRSPIRYGVLRRSNRVKDRNLDAVPAR